MLIGDFLAGIFKPLADVVEHLTVSGSDKIALQTKILEAQIGTSERLMDYEKQLLAGQSDIIKAEAQGNSWIQRSWRPITMLTFLALVVADSLGWLPFRLAPEAWDLLKIGLGGYVVGRSFEKVAPAVTSAITSRRSQ